MVGKLILRFLVQHHGKIHLDSDSKYPGIITWCFEQQTLCFVLDGKNGNKVKSGEVVLTTSSRTTPRSVTDKRTSDNVKYEVSTTTSAGTTTERVTETKKGSVAGPSGTKDSEDDMRNDKKIENKNRNHNQRIGRDPRRSEVDILGK